MKLDIRKVYLRFEQSRHKNISCTENWIRLATDTRWLDSLMGGAAIQKLEDASSSRAPDNEFFAVLCFSYLTENDPEIIMQ